MEIKEFLQLVSRKKQTIFSILLFFIIVVTILTALQTFKYEAKSRVLLLQHNSDIMDPYNIAKSNQFVSSLLAKVVSSNVFLNDVFEAGFNVDKTYFGDNTRDRLKKWEKTAEAMAINDTGIIEISTFHPDKTQAEQINRAIINIIKTKNTSYYGQGNDISIKVIDEPVLSNWPVRPNILLNLLLTVFIALLVSFYYIILFPEAQYNLNIWPYKKKKEQVVIDGQKNNLVNQSVELMGEYKKDYVPPVNNFHERGDIKNIFNQQ